MKIKLMLIVITAILILGCGKKEVDKKIDTLVVQIEKTPELTWITNLEEAVEKAKSENKTVFVNFTGSDWCGWCIKLKNEVFSKSEFAEYAKNSLILVELDYPQRKAQSDEIKKYNRKILEKFGVRGFPTILLINKENKEIGRTGYQQGGPIAYVEHIKSFIR